MPLALVLLTHASWSWWRKIIIHLIYNIIIGVSVCHPQRSRVSREVTRWPLTRVVCHPLTSLKGSRMPITHSIGVSASELRSLERAAHADHLLEFMFFDKSCSQERILWDGPTPASREVGNSDNITRSAYDTYFSYKISDKLNDLLNGTVFNGQELPRGESTITVSRRWHHKPN